MFLLQFVFIQNIKFRFIFIYLFLPIFISKFVFQHVFIFLFICTPTRVFLFTFSNLFLLLFIVCSCSVSHSNLCYLIYIHMYTVPPEFGSLLTSINSTWSLTSKLWMSRQKYHLRPQYGAMR